MKTQLCYQIFLIPFYLILFGVDTILVSGQCEINQQSILIQLKNELKFDSSLSKKLATWNSNITDCCTWGGVTCSNNGQVIGLDLSNETISGGINNSSVLFGLKNLESLNLGENNFSFVPIPPTFGSLSSLLYLNLSNSRFSGQIPEELSQLTRLEVLDLSETFSYEIRSLKLEKPNLALLVQNLTRLRHLYLDNVNISSQKHDWCQGLSSSLPDLQVLSLSNCQLSGPLDDSLEKLQSLSVIRLALNNLNTSVPDFFVNFTNMTVINLGSCNLNGVFPEKVFQLPNLQTIDLSINTNLQGSLPNFPMEGSLRSLVIVNTNFSGGIPESIGNLKNLSWIELQRNNFVGRIPESMKSLTQLSYVNLSSNKLTGQIPSFQMCKNLTHIDLSRNGLSGMIPSAHFQDLHNLVSVDLRFNGFNGSMPSSLFSLQQVQEIQLSNNNFDGLLANFSNASASLLNTLDLSSNKLEGEIPKSFFQLRRLSILVLSSNNLSGIIEFEDFQSLSNLTILDLSFNSLSIKTSRNISSEAHIPNFSSLKLASCNLTGEIPETICTAINLKVLDLSNNRLSGRIPQCLIELGGSLLLESDAIESHGRLGVLNLANNNLSGRIEGTFPRKCMLSTLDLHGNSLEGAIPKSLVNCSKLQVLNIGNNRINDTYPCYLGGNTNLRVLVLRSNRFHGSIRCGEHQQNWSKLQIFDIAYNSFSGAVPEEFFEKLDAMMTNENGNQSSKKYFSAMGSGSGLYYQDTVTITVKGQQVELVKILAYFMSIDISSNRFSGEIPSTIGQLKELLLLNVSHNEFTGSIPPSLGNLNDLESLDMSSNKLTGEIPKALSSLSFLSFFNVSNNQLKGRIPSGTQFQTFGGMSFSGNYGLCGPPLDRLCTPIIDKVASSSDNGYNWQSTFYGLGVGIVLSIMIPV